MERRLTAILAADMVGYSRLMAADEVGTLARQKTLHTELIDPTIAEYGGRVVKTMGDGVLVEFPSVVDALRCAVTVQLAMPGREAAGEGTDLQTDPNIAAMTEAQRALEREHEALREPWREICGAPAPVPVGLDKRPPEKNKPGFFERFG